MCMGVLPRCDNGAQGSASVRQIAAHPTSHERLTDCPGTRRTTTALLVLMRLDRRGEPADPNQPLVAGGAVVILVTAGLVGVLGIGVAVLVTGIIVAALVTATVALAGRSSSATGGPPRVGAGR